MFYDDFKDCIWAHAELICTVKMSDRSQMKPYKFLIDTAISVSAPAHYSLNLIPGAAILKVSLILVLKPLSKLEDVANVITPFSDNLR